jgi:putative transposase
MKKTRFTETQIVSILKQQEAGIPTKENSRLKKMIADLSLDNQILKEIFAKKGWALPQKGN